MVRDMGFETLTDSNIYYPKYSLIKLPGAHFATYGLVECTNCGGESPREKQSEAVRVLVTVTQTRTA